MLRFFEAARLAEGGGEITVQVGALRSEGGGVASTLGAAFRRAQLGRGCVVLGKCSGSERRGTHGDRDRRDQGANDAGRGKEGEVAHGILGGAVRSTLGTRSRLRLRWIKRRSSVARR